MRLAAVLAILLVASCCAKPTPCPTLPVRPVSPEVVTVVAPATRCDLPELPQPIPFVGFPSPDGQSIYVSKTDMAGLAIYLSEMRSWITAAAACLERQ